MCELLKSRQSIAVKTGLLPPNCPPNLRAICTGTRCALDIIFEPNSLALDPNKTLNTFYNKLEAYQQMNRLHNK